MPSWSLESMHIKSNLVSPWDMEKCCQILADRSDILVKEMSKVYRVRRWKDSKIRVECPLATQMRPVDKRSQEGMNCYITQVLTGHGGYCR